MNGYSREELIGQSIDILNSTAGTEAVRAIYLDNLQQGGVLHTETFHRHKNGLIFPIEVSTSIINVEGRELVLGIDRDITERKRSEAEIKQRLAELEAVNRVSTILRAAHTLDDILPQL